MGNDDIYELRDVRASPLPYHSYDNYRGSKTPIVIDNGGCKCRMGWAGEADPRLVYR